MRTAPAFAFALVCSLFALSCAAPPPEPLSMHVTWGITGTTALPPDVTKLEIVTCVNAGQADETCMNSQCTVNALTLMTEGDVPTCRPREGTEMFGMDPVLVRTGLDTHTPLSFQLQAKDEGDRVLFVGHAGPFLLGTGERRFVEMHMYEVGRAELVPGTSVPRFLHTATRLPDGRVLVAGGFTSAQRMAACPDEPVFAPDTRCFDLVATDQAVAFDPTSGSLEPIRSPMLAARGGHTATALPDGRVLIAGGAERAVLAMVPQGAAAVGGYAIVIVPQAADGTAGAHASFELFDAYLDAETDEDRNGDLGAGGFLGIAGQRSPIGVLNQPRFLHAAATVPAQPDLVVLAGGMGGAESATTYEVFDNRRAGGYGVYTAEGNVLPTPRPAPSAVGIDDQVWIFGGALAAADNADLADVWSAEGGSPNGAVTPAADGTQFPNAVADAGEQHPEYALLRPLVASIGDGSNALVVGWYGAQCEPGMSMPVFAMDGVATEQCIPPGPTTTRSFTVAGATGLTSPTAARPRSFGAAAEVGCFKPGRPERYVVMTGGIANTTWIPQASIDVFTGDVDAMGAAQRSSSINLSLASPRVFHTSTGLPGFGVVTVGGVTFGSTLEQVIFQSAIEVSFLPSPSYEGC